jgi:hypothetical protein
VNRDTKSVQIRATLHLQHSTMRRTSRTLHMNQCCKSFVSTRHLRRNFLVHLVVENGVARRVWRKINRHTGWITLLRRGTCRSVAKVNLYTKSFSRYPTFVDALRDIDDALCMVFMFASLPSNDRIPPSLIENCSRLAAEWQLYIMHTKSLRKIFLSIKGVYYQAEVQDQTVTWLVPYQFTQSVSMSVVNSHIRPLIYRCRSPMMSMLVSC